MALPSELKQTGNETPAPTSVAVQGQRNLAAIPPRPDYQEREILAADILVPQIMLMQALSDFVIEEKAKPGQIVRSTPFEVLGGTQGAQNPSKPVEFIPLKAQNLWMYQEFVPGKKKPEYRGMVPRDGGLDDLNRPEIQKTGSGLPWDFDYQGNKWRRVKVFNVFALLPTDILAYGREVKQAQESGEFMDPDKMLMPVVISFRNTSFKAGQEVATYMSKAESMKTVPFGGIFELTCEQDSNDQGTFYVFKVVRNADEKKRRTAKDWLGLAQEWTNTLRNQKVRIDETGLDSDGIAPGAEPKNVNQF